MMNATGTRTQRSIIDLTMLGIVFSNAIANDFKAVIPPKASILKIVL
jgi:hypothetical protein